MLVPYFCEAVGVKNQGPLCVYKGSLPFQIEEPLCSSPTLVHTEFGLRLHIMHANL